MAYGRTDAKGVTAKPLAGILMVNPYKKRYIYRYKEVTQLMI